MIALLCLFLTLFASPFKSKSRLAAENAALRHQLTVLQRKVPGRVRLTNSDRLFLVQLYRWFPAVLKAITIIRPETLVRWHRTGFRHYWRWKSRSFGGRPQIAAGLRVLIRRMSVENPLWGAPRIHGELLKLGFEVAQSSVAKYMAKRHGPPSQEWRTFLHNHAPDIAAMDLFVAPTIGFDLLYGLVIIRLARRDLVWINVTSNPTAEWIARQITEAFPWDEAPHYLIRDRDRVYGATVTRRMRTRSTAMEACSHLATIRDVAPSARGCEECLRIGARWVHLRLCRTCGHVGCCDDSPNRHATKHFHATGHPIIEGYDPPEGWGWCYLDEVIFDLSDRATPQDGPIPRYY